MSIIKKYWGVLRRQRLLHVVNNLLHYNALKKNKQLYASYGVNKSVVSSIAHKDFRQPSADIPWLDREDAAQRLKNDDGLRTFSAGVQEQIMGWPANGYMKLPGLLPHDTVDKINSELEELVSSGKLEYDYTGSRIMNAYRLSPAIKEVMYNDELVCILSYILGKPVIPFQSISFFKGSGQHTHSDSIHMTTEPLGYLGAVWIALEDVGPGAGPLHYYPGSHKLPYVMSEDFENGNTYFSIGEDYYGKYEQKIGEIVREKQLKKEVLLPRKGDAFIWHANLLHGGEPVTDPSSTRKSLVIHYFCDGVINYHEITQRPAVIGNPASEGAC